MKSLSHSNGGTHIKTMGIMKVVEAVWVPLNIITLLSRIIITSTRTKIRFKIPGNKHRDRPIHLLDIFDRKMIDWTTRMIDNIQNDLLYIHTLVSLPYNTITIQHTPTPTLYYNIVLLYILFNSNIYTVRL